MTSKPTKWIRWCWLALAWVAWVFPGWRALRIRCWALRRAGERIWGGNEMDMAELMFQRGEKLKHIAGWLGVSRQELRDELIARGHRIPAPHHRPPVGSLRPR